MKISVPIANPPSRPLMIYDGECHFCRHWIERWREETSDRVDYAPSQEVATQFPEIPAAEFRDAVVLITPEGRAYTGAEAVFRSMVWGRRRWPMGLYENVPPFAAVSETFYAYISRHRHLASKVTRLLWGQEILRPSYFISRMLFLRLLGVVYLIAFISLFVQMDGLIGNRGILPLGDFLSAVKAEYGARAFYVCPTLCWFDSSNAALHLLSIAGIIAAAILIIGWAPLPALVATFCSYLSLTVAGQTFLGFQWDILLLETGFLAIFFAPVSWRLRAGPAAAVSGSALFLLQFLLFKLMFMSGVVKLTSGDPCWWNLTALDYHYWTQPLPTPIAWWADKDLEWFKKFSVAFCLIVEIVVPFFIWSPRRLRLSAATLLISLQVAIALTGNYCFFNLLTISLCLLLVDDASWGRLFGRLHKRSLINESEVSASARWFGKGWRLAALPVIVVTLPLNIWLNYSAIRPEAECPVLLAGIYADLEPFRIVNGYGLFRVMTKERPEIEIEGSADGIDWKPYEFKWKPGAVDRRPGWCAPHQPRLDWQMWFAALGGPRQEVWLAGLVKRLLENEPAVTRLLAHNPFPNAPPHYLRGVLFQYEFTTKAERRRTGAWWKRRRLGECFPQVSLP